MDSNASRRIGGRAIGQAIATLSVVLSLGFVGYEIRQNTATARIAVAQAFTQQLLDITPILTAERFLALNRRVVEGARREDFDVIEQGEIDIPLLGLLRIWESLFRAVQEDVADPEMLEALGDGPGPFRSDYFRDSWPYYRETFTDDFAEFVEESLGLVTSP